jgi:hypothetical protein
MTVASWGLSSNWSLIVTAQTNEVMSSPQAANDASDITNQQGFFAGLPAGFSPLAQLGLIRRKYCFRHTSSAVICKGCHPYMILGRGDLTQSPTLLANANPSCS